MKFVVDTMFKQHGVPYRLNPAVELVTLAQAVRINTTSGDFPGYFVCLSQLEIIYWLGMPNSRGFSAKISTGCFPN